MFWGFSSTLVLNRRHIEATVLYIQHACTFVVLLKEKNILSPFSWRYNQESLITKPQKCQSASIVFEDIRRKQKNKSFVTLLKKSYRGSVCKTSRDQRRISEDHRLCSKQQNSGVERLLESKPSSDRVYQRGEGLNHTSCCSSAPTWIAFSLSLHIKMQTLLTGNT